jgi:hypothetical protein
MNEYGSSAENQPVAWLRGYPIYAAHLVVLVFVASMLLTTLLNFGHFGVLLGALIFDSGEVLRGQVWRIFTYGLVNPPSLWFAVEMFMVAWFGRELEKFFGRSAFLLLYGGLYLLAPLVLVVVGLWRPTVLTGEAAGLALFFAFAALYPNAVMLFNLLAKWVAAILFGIYTLMALSSRDLVGLISLWSGAAYAVGFVSYKQGRWSLPRWRLGSRRPSLRVLPDLKPERAAAAPLPNASMAEMDALLDKIAQSGMASLTAKERAKLEQARSALLRRESGNR